MPQHRRSFVRQMLIVGAISGVASVVGLVWVLRNDPRGAWLRELVGTVTSPETLRNQWRCVDGKHWQVLAAEAEESAATDAREGTRGPCATGMVRVAGRLKLDPSGHELGMEFDALQDKTCTSWISKEFPARCARFDREAWLKSSATLPTKSFAFCMDRFEYPNVQGQNPIIVVTWMEAGALCKKGGKRLCTEAEWTFACEGDEGRPYPYGYERDPEACVIDRPWHQFSEHGLQPRNGDGARAELDRLWQASPSGSHAKCKSPFGVYDMTGNVDEWTRSVQHEGYKSVLKGGYWGPVRARCRPATRAHNETFVAYQQGFRCCADVETDGGVLDAGSDDAATHDASTIADAHVVTEASRAFDGAAAPKAPTTTSSGPSAGAPTEDDEVVALDKRNGVQCAAASAPARSTDALGLGALAAALAALGARRRARRRSRAR